MKMKRGKEVKNKLILLGSLLFILALLYQIPQFQEPAVRAAAQEAARPNDKIKPAKTKKANYLYQNSNPDFNIYLGNKKQPFKPAITYLPLGSEDSNPGSFNFSLASMVLNSATYDIATTTNPALETVAGKNSKPKLFYRDILPDTDLAYEIDGGKGIKEEIILKKNPNSANLPRSPASGVLEGWPNSATFVFDAETSPNIKLQKTVDGLWYFTDEGGDYLFNFDKPFMVDAKGNRSEDVMIDIILNDKIKNPNQVQISKSKNSFEAKFQNQKSKPSPNIKNQISKLFDSFGLRHLSLIGNLSFDIKALKFDIDKPEGSQQYKIILTADGNWLSTATYPVVIDPTITHNADSSFTGQLNRLTDSDTTSNTQLETSYPEQVKDPHTVLLLHFNEANGTAGTLIKDYASTTRVVTANGNASTTNYTTRPGMGNSLALDGTGDYLSIPDSNDWNFGNGDFSIEAWVYPAENSGGHDIISKRDSVTNKKWVLIYMNSTTQDYEFYATSDGSTWDLINQKSMGSVDLNTWTHLAAVRSKNDFYFYKNGVLVSTAVSSASVNAGSYNLSIGTDTGTQEFNGYMDGIRILNGRALTPEEIKAAAARRPYAVYTSQVLGPYAGAAWNTLSWNEGGTASTTDGEIPYDTTNLVAQWRLNETSGTAATSSAGSCQNCAGTLTNFADTSAQDAVAGSGWTANNKRWGAGALMFDGSNDFINAGSPASLDNLGPLTYMAWIWPAATSSTAGELMGKMSTGYAIFGVDYTKNSVYFTKDYSSVNLLRESATNTLKIGEWNHVAVTWDDSATASNIHIYINGKETAYSRTRDGTGTQTSDASSNFNIGRGSDSSYQFKGIVDSASVYSSALSAAEILANYHATNIEFQTRTGASSDPNDGTWEGWKPVTGETQLLSLDSDAVNWHSDIMASTTIATSTETTLKMEGAGSLKVKMGMASTTAETVALWHFEETGTTTGTFLYDETANNNDATTTGTTVIDGIFGKARKFNGTSDHLRALDSASWDFGTGDFTVDAWVNPNAIIGGGANWAILGDANGSGAGSAGWLFLLERTNPGNVYFNAMFSGSWALSVGAAHGMSTSTWNHVAVTRSGTTVTLYVNGRSVGSGTNDPATNITSSRTLYIGSDDGGYYFNGSIDEARVIKGRALSADEIAETYRMGANHHLTRQVSTTDLSGANKLPFYVASDRPGTYLEAMLGESDHANYELASSTLALSTNTVLYIKGDEIASSTSIKDSSFSGKAITANGNARTSGVGKIGNSLYFDGSGDYFSTADDSSLDFAATDNFSIDFWFNHDTISTNPDYAVTKADATTGGYKIYMDASGDMCFDIDDDATWTPDDSSCTSGLDYDNNSWHHVVGVKTGTSKIELFVDGLLVASDSTLAASGSLANTNGLYIGIDNDGSSNGWGGYMDEVRIIKGTALSADQIRQAYEYGLRSHQITIDFGATLQPSDLISNSTDYNFSITATTSGLSATTSGLYLGDKIVIKENLGGTEYTAQGTVNAINTTTGAITVPSWDTGSTFPSGNGYSPNATVFRWQREYFDISGSLSTHRDAVTNLTIRPTNGGGGRTIWLDDFRYNTNYLTASSSSAITSSANSYFQYRAIFSGWDSFVSPFLTSVSTDYTISVNAFPPSIGVSGGGFLSF